VRLVLARRKRLAESASKGELKLPDIDMFTMSHLERDWLQKIAPLPEYEESPAEKIAAKNPDKEAAAKTSLALIEQLFQDGKTEIAKWRLERFIEKYKGTSRRSKRERYWTR
jgi:hypothetical protein